MVKIRHGPMFILEFHKDLILGPLLFLIYINNLSDNLRSNAKFFADGTSLFSVVHDVSTSAKELNDDLIFFSRKSKRSTHPPLVFNNNNVY